MSSQRAFVDGGIVVVVFLRPHSLVFLLPLLSKTLVKQQKVEENLESNTRRRRRRRRRRKGRI
ncbi:hypothetical protein HPP92_019280 [Vanilla planifolia]|uniref:Transmembrane protein n=1 Tax=Vanilla planifolia TaxID=51239 RepID=A0A835QBL4_VANPL|nr:hypothetical protein HPP92_019280 [Vanilla planifolia]